MLNAQTFIDQLQTPSTKLNVKQLREREDFWRALWSWLDDDIKYFLLRVGQQVRVVRRDYKGSVGELGQVKFEAKELEISVFEKTYNYQDGKYYFETKVCKIPFGAITWIEFISSSEKAEEVDRFEVAPLAVTEDTAK